MELIAATTSKTGLRVHAVIGLLPHDFHGEWNYRKRRDKPA